MSKPRVIIGMAESAGGKSTFLKFLQGVADESGQTAKVISDRFLLGQMVQNDISAGHYHAEVGGEQVMVGELSFVQKWDDDPELIKFGVRDGSLLNEVHRIMLQMAVNWSEERKVLLLEWTTGKDVAPKNFVLPIEGGEPLLHSGVEVVSLFSQVEMTDADIQLAYIDADFENRATRNKRRHRLGEGGVPPSAFKAYFKDGGELTPEIATGFPKWVRYRYYNNQYDDSERFTREMLDLSWELMASGGHPEIGRKIG